MHPYNQNGPISSPFGYDPGPQQSQNLYPDPYAGQHQQPYGSGNAAGPFGPDGAYGFGGGGAGQQLVMDMAKNYGEQFAAEGKKQVKIYISQEFRENVWCADW